MFFLVRDRGSGWGWTWGPGLLACQPSSQWVLFYLFPRGGPSQAKEFQIAATTTPRKTVQTTFCTISCIFFHKILQIFCMFLQCFPSKHGNLHICRHKTVPKHHFFYNVSNSIISPNPWKHRYLHCFLQFSCSNAAGQLKHIYKKPSTTLFLTTLFLTTLFFTVFLQCFPSKTP